MRIDASRAIGAYAAVVTLALGWLLLDAAVGTDLRARTLDVERINVREPDGTLRMTIASHALMPGIVVGKIEYPHPNRPEAGMIFFNDEGAENGGLVFEGRRGQDRVTNGGSLTFDRWHQDQTVQLTSIEDGAKRRAGLIVNDQPDAPIDYAAASSLGAIRDDAARAAAARAANLGARQRVFLGRSDTGEAKLVLRDGNGRPRLILSTPVHGDASMTLLDEQGHTTRTVR